MIKLQRMFSRETPRENVTEHTAGGLFPSVGINLKKKKFEKTKNKKLAQMVVLDERASNTLNVRPKNDFETS